MNLLSGQRPSSWSSLIMRGKWSLPKRSSTGCQLKFRKESAEHRVKSIAEQVLVCRWKWVAWPVFITDKEKDNKTDSSTCTRASGWGISESHSGWWQLKSPKIITGSGNWSRRETMSDMASTWLGEIYRLHTVYWRERHVLKANACRLVRRSSWAWGISRRKRATRPLPGTGVRKEEYRQYPVGGWGSVSFNIVSWSRAIAGNSVCSKQHKSSYFALYPWQFHCNILNT